jgi:copper homeostasis protein
MTFLEICVDDAAGVRAAVEGGADRIELCAALDVGGLTPPLGLAAFAVELGVPIRAMIRPRAGSFIFSADDERVMREDIARLLAVGIEGVVLGASHADGRLDVAMLERLIAVARESGARGLTLHRAIDLTLDLTQAVDEAASLGFDTVLSSGGALNASEGAAMLARMRQLAPASLTIMAGSGITPLTVGAIMATSGIKTIHASARSELHPSDSRHGAFGFSQPVERRATAATVRALKDAVEVSSRTAT